MDDLTADEIGYLARHLFLPPQLPQQDDSTANYDNVLLRLVQQTLDDFVKQSNPEPSRTPRIVTSAISHLAILRDLDGSVNESKLAEAFKSLTIAETDTAVPVHIKAQNAAIIVSKRDDAVEFEAFELSPSDSAVIKTSGRLRRCFPGPSLLIDGDQFSNTGLQSVLAKTLSKLSVQVVPSPTVTRPGKVCDTNHPGLVTEMIVAFLQPMGRQGSSERIWKHTREDVLCQNGGPPWRRSPLWLLIRVIMQILFSRRSGSGHSTERTYKLCTLYILASVLDQAVKLDEPHIIANDLLHCMSAKIVRRMLKLDVTSEEPGVRFVQDVLQKTKMHLERKWSLIRLRNQRELDFSTLPKLRFMDDVYISLPGLDAYLSSLTVAEKVQNGVNLVITPGLQRFRPTSFPTLNLNLSPENLPYDLDRFETWVASHLHAWLQGNQTKQNACAPFVSTMLNYHTAAKDLYSSNPEAISVMNLTLLELWVACDKMAVHKFPLLLDYDPQIPTKVLESLLMRTEGHMSRLREIEQYIVRRREDSSLESIPCIFKGLGTAETFSVRYFDMSRRLQSLFRKIERTSEAQRLEKLDELREAKKRYNDLMELVDADNCQTINCTRRVLRDERWVEEPYLAHDDSCARCSHEEEANAMVIEIFEWPLPSDIAKAKSVIFELDVPQDFSSWRDSTMFLLINVLGQEYEDTAREPARSSTHPISSYSALSKNFKANTNQRLGLVSLTPPKTPAILEVNNSTETAQVCVENGSQFCYFDHFHRSFVTNLVNSDDVAESCTYKMPPQSSALQGFICRNLTYDTDSTANEILSARSSCPAHISLAEFRGLAAIPIGYHLQWMNILVQLACPTVDLRKVEATFIFLQAMNQAGPLGEDDDGFRRTGHSVVGDEAFARALFAQIKDAAARIKSNWESSYALGLIVSITARVLSLASSSEVQRQALLLLAEWRKMAFDWTSLLRKECDDSHDDSQKAEILDKLVFVALVSIGTFDVDPGHFETVLRDSTNASIFLKCGNLIYEYRSPGEATANHSLSKIMHQRWQRLACRAFPLLSASVLDREAPTILDDAIRDQWPQFERGPPWKSLSDGCWATSMTASQAGRPLPLHYNFLTGQLLVDGSPLSRLPCRYESNKTYQQIFGHYRFQVVPSWRKNMQFASRQPYSGYTLHFGFKNSRLLIHATRGGDSFELVPSQVFKNTLPDMLVKDFVHWYHVETNTVEFRKKQDQWLHTTTAWNMSRVGERWRVSKPGRVLVDPKSPTGLKMASILEPLQESLQMMFITSDDGQTLDVELPRLQLGFYLEKAASFIMSRDFKGLKIDNNQSIDTLLGLKTKLLLTDFTGDDRRILVPPGQVSYLLEQDHVHVTIKITGGPSNIYKVDQILGILRDNGSLYSKLHLAYLHGLTSFCVPDPFTSHTGTEQSLSILRGAAVRSFQHLTKKDLKLLRSIQALTPRRNYSRNNKAAQSVHWNLQLPILSQHPSYYETVLEIFQQTDMAVRFYPDLAVKLPNINPPDSELLRREAARNSAFRTSSFGSEMLLDGKDTRYHSRDLGMDSERAIRALTISAMMFHQDPSLHGSLATNKNLALDILIKLKAVEVVRNARLDELPTDVLEYDAKYLTNHLDHWANLWCWLHRQSQNTETPRIEPFQITMWFATMAFGARADIDMIHTAAYMFINAEMRDIRIPSAERFRLKMGNSFNKHRLRGLILPLVLSADRCPEPNLVARRRESAHARAVRAREAIQKNKTKAVNALLVQLESQWPCLIPAQPQGQPRQFIKSHLKLKQAMSLVAIEMEHWYRNRDFLLYLQRIESIITLQPVVQLATQVLKFEDPAYLKVMPKTFISSKVLFSSSPPQLLSQPPGLSPNSLLTRSNLDSLLQTLQGTARSTYEQNYARELGESMQQLQNNGRSNTSVFRFSMDLVKQRLDDHLAATKRHVSHLLNEMRSCMERISNNYRLAMINHHGPRLSAIFLLQQLSHGRSMANGWRALPEAWRPWILAFGIALTEVQRATRLSNVVNNHNDLVQELQHEGHINWDPAQYPGSLLLEIESGILIREVQEEIASQMRQPPGLENAVMQLNMGEGKSSVIVPMVAVALADCSKLVRVVVTKAQSRQMFHELVSKLGGLINRQVFTMPFCRKLKLNEEDAQAIYNQCQTCIETGGVLLVQPEHILSLKLMGIEALISKNEALGQALLRIQSIFDAKSRDIVDESDENFSVKFELIYTMGSQVPIDFGPQRWITIQECLSFVRAHASSVQQKLPSSIDIRNPGRKAGVFPRIRLLKDDAKGLLLEKVIGDICKMGLPGFPISRQAPATREAIMRYITEPLVSASDITTVERGPFWINSTIKYLLLLRGLFAGGVLAFVFERKRWRVNYGLDSTRQPPTKLAVPYRAKDSPSPRSEFSHPDIVILLTCISYYYGGLNNEDISEAFEHLLGSEQADTEYQAWVQDADNLSPAFNSLIGINLKDRTQCSRDVFPSFRYAKRTIDYFLQTIIFPKQMRQFPKKLSASGWDLADVKSHPTTGFSGTVGSSPLLPLDVKHLDLPSQRHTDALVLDTLLRPENEVVVLPAGPVAASDDVENASTSTSDVKSLLDVVLGRRDPNLRVILDVGAYILDMTNLQVAQEWLQMQHENNQEVQAAVYFNSEEELMVIDIKGSIEQLRTSPYADQLDVCIVFLDEAHTRGTDLRLPEYYRAAVTLGANLTKDRLVQACMRMRKLGKGQSLIFCVPPEIETKIQEAEAEDQVVPLFNDRQRHQHISVLQVLKWAIGETHTDLWRSTSLWAAQGRRFDRQKALWREAGNGDATLMTALQAAKFLEDESPSLEQRYRPHFGAAETKKDHAGNEREQQILQRCVEIGSLQFDQAALQEEQERELAPEIEEERQTERPPPAEAAEHSIHPDLEYFVSTGVLPAASPAFVPAFQSLRETTAAKHLNVDDFPSDILVTRDFATTVVESTRTHLNSDAYQRPVHWVLTSQPSSWDFVVIISPYEAQELLPNIKRGCKTTLHVYSARPSLGIKPLDELILYTVPSTPKNQARNALPLRLAVQLNLFAGQLFFKSFEEYKELCNMLRICWKEAEEGDTVDADGFIGRASSRAGMLAIKGSSFRTSPVEFLRAFLSKSRKDCQSIGKTQLGRVLDGALLRSQEFELEQKDQDVQMGGLKEDMDEDGDVEMSG